MLGKTHAAPGGGGIGQSWNCTRCSLTGMNAPGQGRQAGEAGPSREGRMLRASCCQQVERPYASTPTQRAKPKKQKRASGRTQAAGIENGPQPLWGCGSFRKIYSSSINLDASYACVGIPPSSEGLGLFQSAESSPRGAISFSLSPASFKRLK